MSHPVRGDQVRASVLVKVPIEEAFRIFVDEIDQWWRRGPRFRAAGTHAGILCIEPHLGGRLFESFDEPGGSRVVETGRVTAFEPPFRLAFEWRATNFAPAESTQVEVAFEPARAGTLVTVTHSGWSKIRPAHPVRHGLETAAFVRMMGLWWGDLLTALREHAASHSP